MMALAVLWIGTPACAHGPAASSQRHGLHDTAEPCHHRHDGLAHSCAGCVLPAIVPDAPRVALLPDPIRIARDGAVPVLASVSPDAQAPPPRLDT